MIRYIICTLAILCLSSNLIFGQNSSEIVTGKTKSEPMQALELAQNLIHYGQQHQDPHALLAAAKIVNRFKAEEAGDDRVITDSGQGDDSSVGKSTGIIPLELNSAVILDRAEAYAGDHPSVMPVIETLRTQITARSRGVARGSGYIKLHEAIPANGQRNFKWKFTGSEAAEIMFVGDPDTDIDVYVYDAKSGKLLASDESTKNGAYFSWMPPETKQYLFRVVNKGNYENTTYIVSN